MQALLSAAAARAANEARARADAMAHGVAAATLHGRLAVQRGRRDAAQAAVAAELARAGQVPSLRLADGLPWYHICWRFFAILAIYAFEHGKLI